MKYPVTISLSPNAHSDDVRLARHLLFVHSYWNDKGATARAAEKIANLFPGHFVSLASSGRQALYDVLRSYEIQKGDEVIIQAFTCIAVPEPILWVGATPVYVDIAKDSYSMDVEDFKKKITGKTKAVIIQHTFGIPGPIKEILAIAKEHNIIVIEDCAHALGATMDGKMVGTFGDAAILSFGRDKCISSVFGGAIITRDKNRAHALHKMQASRPLPPRTWVAQQLFHVVFFSAILPIYFWHSLGKVLLVGAQKLHLLSRAVAYEERVGKRPVHMQYAYSPALALLLLKQLEKLSTMNVRRQTIVKRYCTELKGFAQPLVKDETVPSWLRYPLRVGSPKEILLDARSQEMLLGDWYDAPLVPGSANFENFKYIQGSCPRAEEAAKRIINLPTYPTLTDTQVTKIIAFMNTYGTTGN